MNKIIILGNAYKKGELGESKSGVKYQNFRLMDKKIDKNNTFYFDCVAFGKTAEIMDKYVDNGRQIVVFGEMKEDKNTKKMSVNVLSVDLTSNNEVENKEEKPAEQEDIF